MKTQSQAITNVEIERSGAKIALFALFFVSGFNALLYQVAWQRMLGLFSGSDVRSVTIVIASYLLGLGLGNLISSKYSDRFNSRQCIRVYGCCNLGIAIFAISSRFLFYDLLFLKLRYLAQSPFVMLGIVFCSLLIPTTLMGLSLPLLSKAVSQNVAQAASSIGWLYGCNTLGSGLGTLISGWYIVGTVGYENTVYIGAISSICVCLTALFIASKFKGNNSRNSDRNAIAQRLGETEIANIDLKKSDSSLRQWYVLVFVSGFAAISWEIVWFRVLDIALQSNAYTYAHLLAFVLVSNGLGSMLGSKAVPYIRQPKKIFLLIQGLVGLYSTIAIWGVSIYWQNNPELRSDIGYIDLNNLDFLVIFKYLFVPAIIAIIPNLLLGFYFPLVQKAIQIDDRSIGKRVGSVLTANILGNTLGSLVAGLILLDRLGTSGTIKLLCCLGLGFILLVRFNRTRAKLAIFIAIALTVSIIAFPSNSNLWAALQAVDRDAYFIVAEDSTSVAAIAEKNNQGVLLASGQIQANFPYMHIHGLLGSVPALLHPNPTDIIIIGLGSGGTPHTIGVNPATERVKIIELLGAELTVLKEYAQTAIGNPLKHLFQDPRYQIIVGDGRRELVLSAEKFDIIEADAIQPWRSRAGMLYSQEFFQEVRHKLKPGGFFVEWNVGRGTRETMLSVFPHVASISFGNDLHILIGSDRLVEFEREKILTRLNLPQVRDFLAKARIDRARIAEDVERAKVELYSQAKNGIPQQINTDLFPRGEYYLNSALDFSHARSNSI